MTQRKNDAGGNKASASARAAARNVKKAKVTGLDVIARAEKVRQAIALRLAGGMFTEIAQSMGLPSANEARKLVMEGLQETQDDIRQNAGMYLSEELLRIERLIRAIWPYAVGRPERKDAQGKVIQQAADPDLKAVDRMHKLMDRKARLLGLDAPQRHTFGTATDGGTTFDDAREAILASIFEGPGAGGSDAPTGKPH